MSEKFNIRFATMQELIDEGVIQFKTMSWNTPKNPEKNVDIITFIPGEGLPKKIIKTAKNPKYIYLNVDDRDCYIVYTGLEDTDEPFTNSFKEDVKTILFSMENNKYNYQLNRYGIQNPRIHTNEIIDLREAKMEIENLNRELNCLNYRINLDYPNELQTNAKIYSYMISTENLLLCVFEGNTCVASMQIYIDENKISVDSYTSPNKERSNLNKLLRSISILLSKKISNIEYFVSQAVNPTSAYLLIKYFGASPYIPNEPESSENNIQFRRLFPEDLTTIKHNEISEIMNTYEQIDCIINLNDPNMIQLARQVFTNTVEIIDCQRSTEISRGKTKLNRKNKTKQKRKRKNNRKSKKRLQNKLH
jgi:hypothetical protein